MLTTLIKRINNLIDEKSLLKHPFYVQWSEGNLTLESLGGYSKEYFQLVKAIPNLMNSILKLCPESQKTEIHEIKNEEM